MGREIELRRVRHFLEARFPQDASGRMLAAPPGARGREAPARFVFVRTRLGNLWRLGSHLPRPTIAALVRLAGREAPLGAPATESPLPERLEPMRRLLAVEHEDLEVVRLLLCHEPAQPPSLGSSAAEGESPFPEREGERWCSHLAAPDEGSLQCLAWADRGSALDSQGLRPFADAFVFL